MLSPTSEPSTKPEGELSKLADHSRRMSHSPLRTSLRKRLHLGHALSPPASATVVSLRKLHGLGVLVSAINVHLLRDYHKFAVRLTRVGASEYELGPEGEGAEAVAVVGAQRVRFSLRELFEAQMVSQD